MRESPSVSEASAHGDKEPAHIIHRGSEPWAGAQQQEQGYQDDHAERQVHPKYPGPVKVARDQASPERSDDAPPPPPSRQRCPARDLCHRGGTDSPTTAIAIGSIAPAPTAWKTLMPIRNGRLGERAATAEHSMKNTVATANIRRMAEGVRHAADQRHGGHVAEEVGGDGPRRVVKFDWRDPEIEHDVRQNRDHHRLVVGGDEYPETDGD